MDADMNKYELEHVVTGHAKMSQRNGKTPIARPGIFSTPTSI